MSFLLPGLCAEPAKKIHIGIAGKVEVLFPLNVPLNYYQRTQIVKELLVNDEFDTALDNVTSGVSSDYLRKKLSSGCGLGWDRKPHPIEENDELYVRLPAETEEEDIKELDAQTLVADDKAKAEEEAERLACRKDNIAYLADLAAEFLRGNRDALFYLREHRYPDGKNPPEQIIAMARSLGWKGAPEASS